MTSSAEDASSVYVLVEFVEEECTPVVPLQRISDYEDLRAGQRVKVLWNNRKEYPAIFLLSGNMKVLNAHACVLQRFMALE